MEFILEKCPGKVGIANDIVVHGPTQEEYVANLHNLMLATSQHVLFSTWTNAMLRRQRLLSLACSLLQTEYILSQRRWKLSGPYKRHRTPNNFTPSLAKQHTWSRPVGYVRASEKPP